MQHSCERSEKTKRFWVQGELPQGVQPFCGASASIDWLVVSEGSPAVQLWASYLQQVCSQSPMMFGAAILRQPERQNSQNVSKLSVNLALAEKCRVGFNETAMFASLVLIAVRESVMHGHTLI
jgi:hypothetical protein